MPGTGSHNRWWRVAAVLSAVVALGGLTVYDIPNLFGGADASTDPYWLVIGSFASDVVALVAAWGAWRRQTGLVLLLVIVNCYWLVQAVTTLFAPEGDVIVALTLMPLHLTLVWCCLRPTAPHPERLDSGALHVRAAGPTAAEWGLVAVAGATHVMVAGGVTTWLVSRLAGRDAGSPPWAALAIAGAVTAISAPPVLRWFHGGLLALGSSPTSIELVPFGAVGRLDDTAPAELVAEMATTARNVLDVGGVQIDVWPVAAPAGSSHRRSAWQTGAGARSGTIGGGAHAVALVDGEREIGEVRAWRRRPRAWTPAAVRRLEAVVRQVELIVRSSIMRDELEASRESLLLALEEERRRMRRDLHDGLGPTLAAMKLQLGAVARELDATASSRTAVDQLRTTLAEATDEIRRVVENLRPPLLDDCGLVDAWRNLRFVPPELGLTVTAPEPLPPLPAAIEVALYRIGAEAVHNTVRHASATTCSIELEVSEHDACLLVLDDGVGVGDGATGVGTAAILERARELGGSAIVGRHAGGGTSVSARLPLRPEPRR